MDREIIATDKAPAAVGPYSQAVRVGDFVFTAGQIPLNPATGQMVEGGIEVQTRQALAGQIEELEAARTEAEEALRDVAARRTELQDQNPTTTSAYAVVTGSGAMRTNGAVLPDSMKPGKIDPPRLRAWQFIAHKRELARSRED